MTPTQATRPRPRPYEHRAPDLWIDQVAWDTIMMFTALAKDEINGFGYLTLDSPNRLVLRGSDVFITNQIVTAGSADVTSEDSAMAQYQAFVDGRADDLRFQWHSHVDGEAYCSARDMANIDNVGNTGAAWWVSMVVNKRHNCFTRLDLYHPFRLSSELRVHRFGESTDLCALESFCRAEIADKVTTIELPPHPGLSRNQPWTPPRIATPTES